MKTTTLTQVGKQVTEQARKSGHKLARGFTTIELMTTLTISSVLLGLAAPSFSEFTRGQGAKTAAFDLVAAMTLARSEAIKRNALVEITPVSDDWKNGWVMTASAGMPATVVTLNKQDPLKNGVDITTAATKITYRNDGRLNPGAGSSFEVGGGSTTSCIQVSLSGMPTSKKGSCT